MSDKNDEETGRFDTETVYQAAGWWFMVSEQGEWLALLGEPVSGNANICKRVDPIDVRLLDERFPLARQPLSPEPTPVEMLGVEVRRRRGKWGGFEIRAQEGWLPSEAWDIRTLFENHATMLLAEAEAAQ